MSVGMIFESGQAYTGRAYRDAMVAARLHGVLVVLDILAPSMPFLAGTRYASTPGFGAGVHPQVAIISVGRAHGSSEDAPRKAG